MDVTHPRSFPSRAAWHEWLSKHHATATELWLLLPKKHVTGARLEYEDAIEEALAFGWIDGLAKAYDADYRALRFTPRKPRSVWSTFNIDRVERLIAQGRMTQAGMHHVELARADGRWDAAVRRKSLTLPGPLTAALSASPRARAYFEALPPGKRRIALEWLDQARTEKTLLARCARLVQAAEAGRFALEPARPAPARARKGSAR